MEKVDITPDKSLFKKLGLTGYRTEQAISEIVDNSIDARISGRLEKINVRLSFDLKEITITDNGSGMDLTGLKNALTIAKETKKEGEKLGYFGLGMKSACSTLGRCFQIRTSKKNSNIEYSANYNEEEWLKDKSLDWKNFEIAKNKSKDNWHGTIITISKLNVPLYPNQITIFKHRFGIRYGPYLKRRQISLRINSKICKHVEPKIEKNSRQDISIRLSKNRNLVGWVGLLEKRSIKGDYGIHLYRRDRLIKSFDKFGLKPHPEIAKIVGELHLDHVPVNFHKTGFLEDSSEYVESVRAFQNNATVAKILKKSKSKEIDSNEIQKILESAETTPKIRLDTRISDANARKILKNADRFTVTNKYGKIEITFVDGDSGLYSITKDGHTYKIQINKNSPVFKAFKNPLFLIGLIKLESDLVLKNPKQFKEFLKERNEYWDTFITNWSPVKKKTVQIRKETQVQSSNYSLSDDLVDLHDVLKEKFPHPFQFTGLSTLAPFLHNAYNTMIYNIQTTPGSGIELRDLIMEQSNGFAVLYEPGSIELRTVMGLSNVNKIIVIREYAEKPSASCATPEKAWIDFFVEVIKKELSLYSNELIVILEELVEFALIESHKLKSLARHKKILEQIEPYLTEAL